MDNKASAGITGIPATVLKATHLSIVPYLKQLFNDCIESGVVLDEWKAALITVLHKKGATDDMNQYRGISILPIIFEKIFAMQIKNYFIKKF